MEEEEAMFLHSNAKRMKVEKEEKVAEKEAEKENESKKENKA